MPIELRELDEPREMRVQHPLAHELLHARSLRERPRKAHVGPTHQRRAPRLPEREMRAQLRGESFVGERVGSDLITQEVCEDLLGELERVQRHRRS